MVGEGSKSQTVAEGSTYMYWKRLARRRRPENSSEELIYHQQLQGSAIMWSSVVTTDGPILTTQHTPNGYPGNGTTSRGTPAGATATK